MKETSMRLSYQLLHDVKDSNVAILLAGLVNYYDGLIRSGAIEKGDRFIYTVEACKSSLCLSDFEQRKSFSILESLDLLKKERKGIPAMRYIQLNLDQIKKYF